MAAQTISPRVTRFAFLTAHQPLAHSARRLPTGRLSRDSNKQTRQRISCHHHLFLLLPRLQQRRIERLSCLASGSCAPPVVSKRIPSPLLFIMYPGFHGSREPLLVAEPVTLAWAATASVEKSRHTHLPLALMTMTMVAVMPPQLPLARHGVKGRSYRT